MNNSTPNMTRLYGSTLLENLQISETPVPSPTADETQGYAAPVLDTVEYQTSGRAPLSAQGRKVENTLLLYGAWLMRDYGIHVERSSEGLHLRYDGEYLMLGGLESAIVDWSDDGYVIDPNQIENDTFFFLHEKGGVQVSLNEVTQLYPIEKTGTSWPSVDGVLGTLESDPELRDYFNANFVHGTVWETLSVVALTHRAHRTASLKERVDALRTGALLPPEKQALAWVQSLNDTQLTRVKQLINTRLLLMHDLMDEVQTSALDKGEGKDALTDLAYDRETIEALLVLLRDLGIKTSTLRSLQHLVEPLDERGEEVVTVAPVIESLAEDVLLTRSRELSASTWWTGLCS